MRVLATKFDGDDENVDELGLKYSERQLRDGKGAWCYGKISFVFKKKSRMPQKYKIKYHEGGSMDSLEADIQMAPEDEEIPSERTDSDREDEVPLNVNDRDDEGDDDRHPLDRDDDADEGRAVGVDGTVELDSDEDEVGDEETVTVGGCTTTIPREKESD